MAAPALVAAAKFAAKQMTKKAVSTAKGAASGKGLSDGAKATITIVILFVLVFTGSIVHAVNTTLALMVPQNIVECHGPTSSFGDEAGDAVSGGGTDGSLGSNIPFPEKDSTKIVWPVPNGVVTSGFEMRRTPAGTQDFHGTGFYFHNGVDFGAPLGSPIIAMADGIVAQSAPNNNNFGYGTAVTLHHMINGSKYSTTYGHVLPNSLPFKVGDTVKAGDRIASVGNEGNSAGAHLHFVLTKGTYSNASELNKDAANNINPIPFLEANGAERTTGGTNLDGSPVADGEEAPTVCSRTSNSDGSIVAWGGYQNGEIPDERMKALSFAPNMRLENGAARTLEIVNTKYKAEFGRNLPIVSAYKSIQDQGKGAGEGDDIAGWAKSIELNKSITFDSAEYKWLSANAPANQWMNPTINKKNGSSPLPTRWVYVESNSSTTLTDGNSYKQYASTQLQALGMGGKTEMTCLDNLWTRESEWNPAAANPTSTARGIPQKMMNVHHGPGWETDPAAIKYLKDPKIQIDWGLEYIQGRYKTPCAAWAHSERVNWY